MNHAIQIAQQAYDHRLPPDTGIHKRAVEAWIAEAVSQLIIGNDVAFKRRLRPKQGVTVAQFELAVDEHVNGRLADHKVTTSALGLMVLNALSGYKTQSQAEELIGHSDHPYGMRGQIAEALVRHLAKDGVIAMAEGNDL
ncbi:hypothetical protein QN399_01140 [Pseudomonas sp. 10C3]|uniref:hypothetical protein n=1 Tax=Pseudomonas sp. 10C3 TaxID=3118753 RepID=UPI002E82206D|nr:hypothetical protein [Pseudomonas sp. 10C3]MEE3504880.1 hypothetical protein [Pseudomonas sp. 10C3]